MTMLRRDLLKIAALTPALAGPFAVTPERAAVLMRETFTVPEGHDFTHPGTADPCHPQSFASSMDGHGNDLVYAFQAGAPLEWAEFRRAYQAAARDYLNDPNASDDDLGFGHPLVALEDAAVALWCVSWSSGVRSGVAYEHLRQSLTGPVMGCRSCTGDGFLWDGERAKAPGSVRETCPECSGTGVTQTPVPSLASVIGG